MERKCRRNAAKVADKKYEDEDNGKWGQHFSVYRAMRGVGCTDGVVIVIAAITSS
jgi:hypothetical protein